MKGRVARAEHFGRNSRKALPKKYPIYNMVCLRWWKRCGRGAELGDGRGTRWKALLHHGRGVVDYYSFSAVIAKWDIFRLFAMGRLFLPEGTLISSRRDVRLFPKGRLLSAIGITTTHTLSVTAIAPWGVVGDGECEKGKQGRGLVRRATPRRSGGRSRG